MPTTFLISDTHFGHVGVTKFLREDGTKLRPWDSVEEMDEALIASYSKSTCLWLKNLPKLVSTNVVDKGEFVIHGGRKIAKWYSNREIARDKTFPGIARAMAEQWG